MKNPLPATMKAAQATDYGDPDLVLTIQQNVPVPNLIEALPDPKKRKTHMIIRTTSVALAPGDCRVMSGKTREFQGPPSFPYIPGGDCSGIVVELPDNYDEGYFKIGDYVAARFNEAPRNALAEYAIVSMNICDKVPTGITPDEAAVLASATCATILGDHIIQPDERILVLGANGGQGSHFCQHARLQGAAAYIVGVSDDPQRLLDAPIGCDEAIDYTTHDVWSSSKFQDEPFDTVVDLASGGWPRLVSESKLAGNKGRLIVKSAAEGGRYITTSPDQPVFELHSVYQMLEVFLFPVLWRAFSSRILTRKRLPKYSFVMALPDDREVMTR